MRTIMLALSLVMSMSPVLAQEMSDQEQACTQQALALTRGAVAWKSSFDATGMTADSSYISELLMAFDVNSAYETALSALYIGQTGKDAVFDQLDQTLTQLQFKRGLIVAMLDETFSGSADIARQQEFITSCVVQFRQ